MADPITLGAIIAALIAKSVDRAEDGAVKTGAAVMRKALDTVRGWFSREDDEEGQQILEDLEKLPDSSALAGALAGVLDERAGRDPELRAQLEALKEEAQEAGIDVDSVVQVAVGDGNVQIANTNNSEINVNQGTSPRTRE